MFINFFLSATRPTDAEFLDELKSKYDLSDTSVRHTPQAPIKPPSASISANISTSTSISASASTSIAVRKDKQPAPKLKKERSRAEEKMAQDVEAAKKKKAEAEQAKLLKEQQKKEKKAAKEASTTGRRRGSISEKWRARKNSTVDPMKSPPVSPRLPLPNSGSTTPTSPPTSPLIFSETADSLMPALDISDKRSPTLPEPAGLPVLSAADLADEAEGHLPSLLDESLIFNTEDMHQVWFICCVFCDPTVF